MSATGKVRAFIALPSTPELNARLREIQLLLREAKGDVKWDTPDKFHITLKFLGNVDSPTIEGLAGLLTHATSTISAFSLSYSSVGAFPDLIRPRVIWAGAEPNQPLLSLHTVIETTCEQIGFTRETRTFHPHITLGRVKGSTNLQRLTAIVKSITLGPIVTLCPEILLIKSDLQPAGSVYTTLKSFPLKG